MSGILIRTLKEQGKYIKSIEYQNLLYELEEMRLKREAKLNKKKRKYIRIYNLATYKADKELEKLKHKDTPLKTRYDPILLDKIPTIINLQGKIIHPSNK